MLLLSEVDLIFEKWSCKKYVFKLYGPSCFKIIFALLAEIITLYMQVTIIKVGILSLNKSIARRRVYIKLAMFLSLNK